MRKIALELNVNYHTVWKWVKKGAANETVMAWTKEKRHQDRRAPEQLQNFE